MKFDPELLFSELWRYISDLKKLRRGVYNCRCFICGDSKTNKRKKRFYIFSHRGNYFAKCFNCGYSSSLVQLAKNFFPQAYQTYLYSLYEEKPKKKEINVENIDITSYTMDVYKYDLLSPLSSLSEGDTRKKYIRSRMIPEEYWKKHIFCCDDFLSFLKYNNETFLSERLQNTSFRKISCFIFPIYQELGKSFSFVARPITSNNVPKYITIKRNENCNKIWGLEKIKGDSYFVVEGIFDAMVLGNAVATTGIIGSEEALKGDPIFVFDNEPRNKALIDAMGKMLEIGKKVVIFPKTVREKDINDMALNGIDFRKIISENTFSGLLGKIKLDGWRRLA